MNLSVSHDNTHPSQIDNASNYSENHKICETTKRNTELLSQNSFNSATRHPVSRQPMTRQSVSVRS